MVFSLVLDVSIGGRASAWVKRFKQVELRWEMVFGRVGMIKEDRGEEFQNLELSQ